MARALGEPRRAVSPQLQAAVVAFAFPDSDTDTYSVACVRRMADSTSNPLDGVEAYVFDVFGTVVDWYGSLTRVLELQAGGEKPLKNKGERVGACRLFS